MNKSQRFFHILLIILATMFSGIGGEKYSELRLRVSLAESQMRIMDTWFFRAIESKNRKDITETIETITSDYPSGTKQIKGSSLDKIVERHRSLLLTLLEQRNRDLSK